MAKRITSVEVVGNKIIVRERWEYNLTVFSTEEERFNWLKEKGFITVVPTWHGYGVARHVNGMWYQVDLKEKRIESQIGIRLPRTFFLGFVVPPEEWGSWVKEIPVIVKKEPTAIGVKVYA